jgi:hypothetical protein
MLFPRLAVIAAFALTVGCTHASILRLDQAVRPQTHPDSIKLIAQDPGRPYTVIAIVSARGEAGGNTRGRLLKEAAKLGGEAVLLDISSLTVVGGDESQFEQITGKVIVFNKTPSSN